MPTANPAVSSPPRVIRLLTNSRLKASRRCPRYHQIKYDQGVESLQKAEPLIFGNGIHAGLEPWWLFWAEHDDNGDGALEAALLALEALPDLDPFLRAKAQAMLEGYHHRYAPEMREGAWEILGVELEFVAPLVDPSTRQRSRNWVLGGKLDVLARYLPTKRRHLIEHKSSSEDLAVGADYWKRLRMDSQISHYFEGAASIGEPVDECTYDVLRKPDQRRLKATPEESRKYTVEKIEKKTGRVLEPARLYKDQRERDESPAEYLDRVRAAIAEKPEVFFRRESVVRLEREIEEHRWDTWEQAQVIEQRQRSGFSPRNPDGCEMYGRTCEMFPVCTGAASLDDRRLFQLRKTIHPELSFFEAPIAALPTVTEEATL